MVLLFLTGKDSIGECNKYPHDNNHKDNYPRPQGTINMRNNGCDDCRITPIDDVRTIHYTACKKPWSCPTARTNNNDKKQRHRINTDLTNITMCMNLHMEWFKIRKEFDELHYFVSKDKDIVTRNTGTYNPEYFLGYCEEEGKYIPIKFPESGFDIAKLYPQMKEM